MTIWLDNPKGKGRKVAKAKRKPPAGYRSWGVYMDFVRSHQKRAKGTAKKAAKRRGRRATTGGGGTVATKRKRRAPTTRRRRATKRRRTYRRNPPVPKALRTLQEGAVNAAFVTAGKVGVAGVKQLLPASVTAQLAGNKVFAIAADAAIAIGVGMAAQKVAGTRRAEFVVAGALSTAMESLLRGVGVPGLSAYLPPGGRLAAYLRPGVQALRMLPPGGDLGDYDEVEAEDEYSYA